MREIIKFVSESGRDSMKSDTMSSNGASVLIPLFLIHCRLRSEGLIESEFNEGKMCDMKNFGGRCRLVGNETAIRVSELYF